jgi:UDP-glucuronate 4-epimerase
VSAATTIEELAGRRVLVTGVTGQVAEPVARALAAHASVIGLARFKDDAARARLEAAGIECVPVDLATGEFEAVPANVDHVLHFGVVKSGRWDVDLRGNAEAVGLLMQHCRGARSFLHCSSTGVYEPAGTHPLAETDPLGDNHRPMMPTYSISKIAAEAVVRASARMLDLPTTIARLNVPYGDNGGWPAFHLEMILAGQPVPVSPTRPDVFNPIHQDDVIATIPALLAVADVPATIVNWAGDETVGLEEWCAHLAALVGRDATFAETEHTIASVATDNARMHELVGHAKVSWREGMERMARARHPELF